MAIFNSYVKLPEGKSSDESWHLEQDFRWDAKGDPTIRGSSFGKPLMKIGITIKVI